MSQVKRLESRSARIREQLGHPVIDGDGHVHEVIPAFRDFIRDHGRGDLVEKAKMFNFGPAFYRDRREASADERRRRGVLPAAWFTPTDSEYFAAVSSPSRYYERLSEAGIDFSVLYPTVGLHIPHLGDDEMRVELCRFYNEFMADQYRPYGDRFTMAALIPMNSPDEAVSALTHAHGLGAKVGMLPSYVRRPLPGMPFTGSERGEFGTGGWLDTYGLDSFYDYDPVWSKAIELGMPLACHSTGMGFSDRISISNYTFNGCGHFAAAGDALAKSLFLGGVTRRFPRLRLALLEGGVVAGVRTYSELVGRWKKRGAHAIGSLNPENLDRDGIAKMLVESDPRLGRYTPEELVWVWASPKEGRADFGRDDFEEAGIHSQDDILKQFCSCFYWGCEGDDPMVGLAFDTRFTPAGARIPAIFGSDIGHWDVPEFDSPLAEAYELVEDGMLDEAGLRDFVFLNALNCYGSLNPDFFKGTPIESELTGTLQPGGG